MSTNNVNKNSINTQILLCIINIIKNNIDSIIIIIQYTHSIEFMSLIQLDNIIVT